jgi:hypothetical protein
MKLLVVVGTSKTNNNDKLEVHQTRYFTETCNFCHHKLFSLRYWERSFIFTALPNGVMVLMACTTSLGIFGT